VLLIISQVAIATGVNMYNEKYAAEGNEGEGNFNIGIVHVALYFSLIGALEVAFRIYNKRVPKPYKVPNASMTLNEFKKRVFEHGEQLCILDDLVLDVKEYMENHPGGRFLISHTVGTDISKFFYGGYALD